MPPDFAGHGWRERPLVQDKAVKNAFPVTVSSGGSYRYVLDPANSEP